MLSRNKTSQMLNIRQDFKDWDDYLQRQAGFFVLGCFTIYLVLEYNLLYTKL